MANFIVNDAATEAVRKNQVIGASVQQIGSTWQLLVKLYGRVLDVVFETAETEEDINTKAAAFMSALET